MENQFTKCDKNGQVDSPGLLETPEITEMTENFTKVTKYLTKFKEALINYVWEKSHVKSSTNKIFRGFHVFEYVLWQQAKTRQCRKSTERFLNQKITQC